MLIGLESFEIWVISLKLRTDYIRNEEVVTHMDRDRELTEITGLNKYLNATAII